MIDTGQGWRTLRTAVLFFALFLAACSGGRETAVPGATDDHAGEAEAAAGVLALPELRAAALDGVPLKVVATTSVAGDVVAQVGGEAIELTTLIGAGQDAHGYQAAARDLTAVAEADVIFVNGWDLEEGLAADLKQIGADVPIVPISAAITPLLFAETGGDEEHDHGHVDPHVWFSVRNVEQWAENARVVLSALDPANAAVYESNAAAFGEELEALQAYAEAQMGSVPEEARFLVTNHGSFNYLADEYGYTVLGTVIPATSTLAEPSASDLAELISQMEAHGVCTLFTETAVSDRLAQTVAGELAGCAEVRVVPLYSGSIGPAGSGADSYTGMFRANIEAIVEGLR